MFRGSQLVGDWNKFNRDNPKHRRFLAEKLQFFLSVPDRFPSPQFAEHKNKKVRLAFAAERKIIQEAQAKIQQFATTGDFPASILPVIEKFHAVAIYDNIYEQIFDIKDFSGSGRNGFDILDVESGLSFRKILVGEKLDVFQMSGEKTRVYFDFYGGALGWHRQLFDDREYWTIEDNAIAFRNTAYQNRAAIFYALLEAVATAKASLAWQAPEPATLPNTSAVYTANRDAQTMNLAAQTILLACQNKGYGITPGNVNFIVLTPIQQRGRIRRALNVMLQATTGSEKQIDYNFIQASTLMLTNTNRYWVILPKKKLKGGYRMDLRLFTDFDILSYTDTQAGWMRFGGAIGDTDQVESCLLA